MSKNTITITGNLGKPAETRYTKSGKPVTTLNLGHTPRIKQDGEWTNGETLWFKVTVWDALPEIVFDKGAAVIVTGELRKETWTTEAGESRESLAINADSVGILHRIKPVNDDAPQSWPAASSSVNEDTPF